MQALWASATDGQPVARAVMQGDGNFVAYTAQGVPLWASHTEGHPGAEISRGLADGLQFKQIAFRLGRDPSVISREVRRHGGRDCYRAVTADDAARAGRERPKKLAVERSHLGWSVGVAAPESLGLGRSASSTPHGYG